MEGFDDIIKTMQWSENINKSLGLHSQIAEILKVQGKISDSLTGFNTISQLAKKLQQQDNVLSNLTGLHMLTAIAKSTTQQQTNLHSSLAAIKSSQFSIPQSSIDAIASISRQHETLFENLRSITKVFNKNESIFSQINTLQFAFSGLSAQLASIANTTKRWDLIDDFEEITQEAVSLNDRIYSENGITKDGYNELKEFFQRIEIKVDKIDVDANVVFWKILALLSFILTLTGEMRNWIPKPEYATKQEVETLINKQFSTYQRKLKEDKEFRIVSRVCKVMSKPFPKADVIEKLPVDFEVTILQIDHKWIYVTYFSACDNLPKTGWIMKKYLKKGSH